MRRRRASASVASASGASAHGAGALGALAVGAAAAGAGAVGALAIGRLAIGRLSVGRGRVAKLAHPEIWLLLPATYMNESGRAVTALASFYKIEPREILVVHDELDLPPGSVKLKLGGGLSGHNGLKDIT